LYNIFIGSCSGSTYSVSCSISIGKCSQPTIDGDLVIGSSLYPVLTSATSSGVTASHYLSININGIRYKIGLIPE
jgi:hypothetical protein